MIRLQRRYLYSRCFLALGDNAFTGKTSFLDAGTFFPARLVCSAAGKNLWTPANGTQRRSRFQRSHGYKHGRRPSLKDGGTLKAVARVGHPVDVFIRDMLAAALNTGCTILWSYGVSVALDECNYFRVNDNQIPVTCATCILRHCALMLPLLPVFGRHLAGPGDISIQRCARLEKPHSPDALTRTRARPY